MKKLFNCLKEHDLTISFAESMTGGKLSTLLTKNAGASKVFVGAIVAYSKQVKERILNVDSELIDKYSVVSKEIAHEMIVGLKSIINSDIYVTVTGNAGPSYDIGTKELECFVEISYQDKVSQIHMQFKSGNRRKNINEVVKLINNKIIKMICI
ncbi:MAG: nicotinamide-nucleotide amidohydrolase family protein [Acholeplasma sp.]|nr:nicotinamide-nucleotide amidohydrolase family protein [Acholeplasma sp.]